MQKNNLMQINPMGFNLFERVASIIDQARRNVLRSVNTNTVLAYWLIGREIVEEIQGGEKRARYGKLVIENLSEKLSKRYGKGYSVTSLKYFRTFYKVYSNRFVGIGRQLGDELEVKEKGRQSGDQLPINEISYQTGNEFAPELSWSHYRALMRVKDDDARAFYEQEAISCGWSKEQLERQIRTSYYERILANSGKEGLYDEKRERLPGEQLSLETVLKSPYILEFLGLPDSPKLHENILEQAIIDNLQSFLLELGKGFSFIARQRRIRFDDNDFYIDLVFYNFILKCYMLVDLKIGKLTHQDVGQMDGYVRLFEEKFKNEGDNPTIGLILCSNKSEAVAKYSILKDSRQIFASKYLQFLPSEEELQIEIEKERSLIEYKLREQNNGTF